MDTIASFLWFPLSEASSFETAIYILTGITFPNSPTTQFIHAELMVCHCEKRQLDKVSKSKCKYVCIKSHGLSTTQTHRSYHWHSIWKFMTTLGLLHGSNFTSPNCLRWTIYNITSQLDATSLHIFSSRYHSILLSSRIWLIRFGTVTKTLNL